MMYRAKSVISCVFVLTPDFKWHVCEPVHLCSGKGSWSLRQLRSHKEGACSDGKVTATPCVERKTQPDAVQGKTQYTRSLFSYCASSEILPQSRYMIFGDIQVVQTHILRQV